MAATYGFFVRGKIMIFFMHPRILHEKRNLLRLKRCIRIVFFIYKV